MAPDKAHLFSVREVKMGSEWHLLAGLDGFLEPLATSLHPKLSAEFSSRQFLVGLRSHIWLALSQGWALLLEAVHVPSHASHVAPPATAGHIPQTLCTSLSAGGENAVFF